jgi:hypothetical protein
MIDRPWAAPGRHWADRPEVIAGLDHTAGGSWLGINDHGVVAAILNRRSSLGPAPGKRSRGELVLEALDHADAAVAAEALADLDPAAYRSFNMVVADNRDAYWLRNLGNPDTKVIELDETVISGNQELPKVLYIVPWQQPDGLPDIELSTQFEEVELFRRLYPPAYRRELAYFEAASGDGQTSNASSDSSGDAKE